MGQTINKKKFVYMMQNSKVRLKWIQTPGSFKAEWVMFQHFFLTLTDVRCLLKRELLVVGQEQSVSGNAKSYLFIFKVQYEYPVVDNLI